MKKLIFLLSLSSIFFLSCQSTYEKQELYGHWKNDNWDFIFNEDGTCKVGKNAVFQKGNWTYRTFGNTLEIVRDGKVVLSNLTIKGIHNNELSLEFRNIANTKMDNIQRLKRQ